MQKSPRGLAGSRKRAMKKGQRVGPRTTAAWAPMLSPAALGRDVLAQASPGSDRGCWLGPAVFFRPALAIVSRFAQPCALNGDEGTALVDGCLVAAWLQRRRGRGPQPALGGRHGQRFFVGDARSGSAWAAPLLDATSRRRPHLSERHAMEVECSTGLSLSRRALGCADAV